MNKKLLTKNSFIVRYRGLLPSRYACKLRSFSFIICCLLLASCYNPFNPAQTLPEGYGSFTLCLADDTARTIMPSTPTLSQFQVLNLNFSAVSGGGVTQSVDINSYNGSSTLEPVVLVAGTYSLTVSAYKGPGKTNLAAQGTTTSNITITAGNNVNGNVILKAIFGSGTGTFKWNITLSTGTIAVTTATMTIKNSEGVPQGLKELLANTGTTTGTRDLPSGEYTVVFNLTSDGDKKTVVWSEILHVYSTLESNFSFTFTAAHFTTTHWDVIFDKNYSGGGSVTQSVLHGDTISETQKPSMPDRAFTPVAGLFSNPLPTNSVFAGWDDSNNVTFNFSTAIHGNTTLKARWTPQPINISGETGSDVVAKAVSYVKTHSGDYTLFLDADISSMSSSSLTANSLTIKGLSEVTLSLSGQNLFYIMNSGTVLTIGDKITLQGTSSSSQGFVAVSTGGTFNMTGGKITGYNMTASLDIAAVKVSNGTFNMSGGIITGNSNTSTGTNLGGAVYVNNGTFIMSGNAEITGNTANSGVNDRAAVYITGASTFKMDGNSKVYSNTSPLGDVYIASSNVGFSLWGNATIGTLTLNAQSLGAASHILINSSWTGVVSSLNLRGNDSTIANVISDYWLGKEVLQGTGVTGGTIARFTLGDFITNATSGVARKPITDANTGAPNGYMISTSAGTLGKLVVNDVPTFDNFLALSTYIEEQDHNTADTPYRIKLRVNNMSELNSLLDALNSPLGGFRYVSIELLGGITSIGDDTFEDCEYLTGIIIPDSVITIGDNAFHKCISLTSVTIPNSVTSIGDNAFNYCISLTSVTIPASVTYIGEEAFVCQNSIVVDSGNTCYSSEAGVLYDKNKTILIRCPIGKAGSFEIPDSVKRIEGYAFSDCTSLTSVTIPNSVKSIGDCAFSFCYSLTSITIPDSVTSIELRAFSSCLNLTSVTIQDGVPSIGSYAFANCSSLTSVTIPNSVTSIGESAFESCTNLVGVIIPSNVTSIDDKVFMNCTNLTSVIIPANVTSIGGAAFANTGLTSITIPDTVNSIANYAFRDCTSLTSVTFVGTISSGSFGSINPFPGDLRTKFYAANSSVGTLGTYTRPTGTSSTWTKQP